MQQRPIGLILLAAGGSRRLGSPKQLLRDSTGQSLTRRAAQSALGSVCRPVVAVLGASAPEVREELSELPLQIIVNSDWETGMASSIETGLSALTEDAEIESVLVMLCDQPHVSARLLDSLVAAYHLTKHPIIACEYGGITGVPALFDRSQFPALLALRGEEGARRVIRACTEPITRIAFPEGVLDIDTPQDAERWNKSS